MFINIGHHKQRTLEAMRDRSVLKCEFLVTYIMHDFEDRLIIYISTFTTPNKHQSWNHSDICVFCLLIFFRRFYMLYLAILLNYYTYGASSHRIQWTDEMPSFKMGVWKILCCEFWDNNSSITHSSLMHNDLNQFLYVELSYGYHMKFTKQYFFKSHFKNKLLVSTLNIITRCTMNITILANYQIN